MEDKVSEADFGNGKFHFNFQAEEDIQEVLRNAPYHYDSWMVSVVRWEPVVTSGYPSEITFWARVRDLPFQYWTEGTIRALGKALGKVEEVEENSGYVRVTFNGFNPLVFTTIVPFDNGDEIKVNIEYENLANYYHHCFRMSHFAVPCLELYGQVEQGGEKKGKVHQGRIIS